MGASHERTPRSVWAEFFGIAAADLRQSGLSIVSHVGLDGYRGVWFFLRGARLVVSAPTAWVQHIRDVLARAPNPTGLPDQEALAKIFGSNFERSIGPAFHGSLEASQFRSIPSSHVRALTDADSGALSEFRDLCGAEDWNDSALEKAQLLRYGSFDSDRQRRRARTSSTGATRPAAACSSLFAIAASNAPQMNASSLGGPLRHHEQSAGEVSDVAAIRSRLSGRVRALDRARSLLRSNFGRSDGWYVELDGIVVGELEDAVWVDMFWDSYSLRCVAAEHGLALQKDQLWHTCALVFRNRRTREIAGSAFAGGSPVVRDGRVTMRGLYLVPASILERACLRVLELFGARNRAP